MNIGSVRSRTFSKALGIPIASLQSVTLEAYRAQRMIVQHPDTPVREAACAMLANHVGIVVVQKKRRVVGVLTDRDIAVRVVAAQLDAGKVTVGEVMTPDPVTLPSSATQEEVLAAMHLRHVRRIPLVDADTVIGLVSLDDLILSEDVDLHAVAEVIRDQLSERAAMKPAGPTDPVRPARPARGARGGSRRTASETRRAAHGIQTWHRAGRLVQDITGLADLEQSMAALEAVVGKIAERLTPTEAADLMAQLPLLLKEKLAESISTGPVRSVTRETVELELARRLELEPEAAHEMAARVGIALTHLVSAGEIAQVRAQLPEDLRSLISDEVAHREP